MLLREFLEDVLRAVRYVRVVIRAERPISLMRLSRSHLGLLVKGDEDIFRVENSRSSGCQKLRRLRNPGLLNTNSCGRLRHPVDPVITLKSSYLARITLLNLRTRQDSTDNDVWQQPPTGTRILHELVVAS